jgi:hypothetical protein
MSQSDHAKFDPVGQVTFDLPFGHVHLDGAPERVVVPADALTALCQAAGADHVARFGRTIGEAIGRRIRTRLGAGQASEAEHKQRAVRGAPFELMVEHLAGELALLGLGALSAERWGRVLVLVVDRSPLAAAADGAAHRDDTVADALLAAVLAAALEAAAGANAELVRLVRETGRARFAVLSPAAAGRARAELAAGRDWTRLLATFNAQGAQA